MVNREILLIKLLIKQLEQENLGRTCSLRSENCPEYSRTVITSAYNNTIDIIKRLNKIIE